MADVGTFTDTLSALGGLEIVDHEEEEEERYCTRYLLSECKNLASSDDIDPLMSILVPSLANRPRDFLCCVEEAIILRRNALVMKFTSAFKTPSTSVVEAHDPFQYLKDMLHWLRQKILSEYNFAHKLLWPNLLVYSGPLEVDYLKTKRDDFKMAECVRTIFLNRIFEVYSEPLEESFDQVLESCPSDVKDTYKLSVMLEKFIFYVPKMDSEEFTLGITVRELHDCAQLRFAQRFCCLRAKILELPPLVSVDLPIPSEVREGVSALVDIIIIHDECDFCEEKLPFDGVISDLLDPILRFCVKSMVDEKTHGSLPMFGPVSTSSVDDTLANVSSAPVFEASDASIAFLLGVVRDIIQPLVEQEKPGHHSRKLASEFDEIIKPYLGFLAKDQADEILQACRRFSQ